MTSRTHDIGAYIKGVKALTANVVASSVGGGVEQNGDDVDRNLVGRLYRSCKLMVPYVATVAVGQTVTLKANTQDGASSTAYTDYADADGSTAVSAIATTAAPNGVLEMRLNLGPAKRFVRVQLTPTLTAATADTVAIAGVHAFGGGEENPAT